MNYRKVSDSWENLSHFLVHSYLISACNIAAASGRAGRQPNNDDGNPRRRTAGRAQRRPPHRRASTRLIDDLSTLTHNLCHGPLNCEDHQQGCATPALFPSRCALHKKLRETVSSLCCFPSKHLLLLLLFLIILKVIILIWWWWKALLIFMGMVVD